MLMKILKVSLTKIFSAINIGSFIGNRISISILSIMVALITVDVIGRYFLNRPTYIADELSGYFLVVIIFLSLAQTQKKGKHVIATVLTSRLSPGKSRWLEISTTMISFAFIVWFAWRTALAVHQSYVLETTTITTLHTPYWIPQLLLPIGLSMFALQLLVHVVQLISLRGTIEGTIKVDPFKDMKDELVI
jgi:TRAP-type C4-dicarboxylate transport system permease small subunit